MRSPGADALRGVIAAAADLLPAPPAELLPRTLAIYRAEVRLRARNGRETPVSATRRIVLSTTFTFLPSLVTRPVAVGLGLSKPFTMQVMVPKPLSVARVARLFGLA